MSAEPFATAPAASCPVRVRECEVEYGGATALPSCSLRVEWGEAVALMGPSGSGKTTLLEVLRGEVRPSAGSAAICGVDLNSLRREPRRKEFRRLLAGVDQLPQLMSELSVAENVALPLLLDGDDPPGAFEAAKARLEEVGLGGLDRRGLDSLSGGELQRVAIARALVRPTAVILADEPTASLDRDTAVRVADLLVGLVRGREERALLMATHDPSVAATCDRVVRLVQP